MASPPGLKSHHIFLFPFDWKLLDSEKKDLAQQANLEQILFVLKNSADWQQLSAWTDAKTLIQYNEANYFYDFVRPILYGDEKGKFQVHFQHKNARGSEYVISLPDRTYRLELDDIGISFFNLGVGLLSFHCYNRKYESKEDILKINQFGRRLFPPYFSTDFDKFSTQSFFEDDNWARGLTGCGEISKGIFIEKHGKAWVSDDFSEWRADPKLDTVPGLVRQLLPRQIFDQIKISPVLDDRMFVVCWYGNDELAKAMKDQRLDDDNLDKTDWWYQFIFVDAGYRTCRDSEMVKKLLPAHSNLRWQKEGTLYGVSRYSFVCLTGAATNSVGGKMVASHVQTIYFKLAELCLIQRACVLRFSEEVAKIGELETSDRTISERSSSLMRQYIRFVNKVYFREVTAQEQGIELYDQLQKHMRTDGQVKDLDREIQELHQYVALLEEDKRNEKLDVLTYLGTFFVVPSFVCTYLGINDFDMEHHLPGIAALCFFSAFAVFGIVRSSGKWRWFYIVAAVLLMLFVLFFFPNGKFQHPSS